MAAELEPHGGEQAVLELRLAARAEAFEERGGEDVRRHPLVDRGVERPSPLAGIGDPAGEALEARIARERGGGEVEQPGGDDAAAAPHLGDVGEVEVVLVVDWVAERSRLGIRGARPLPHVRITEDVEPLGVGRHEAYSMPLWTIFTKWPAPFGPQCR